MSHLITQTQTPEYLASNLEELEKINVPKEIIDRIGHLANYVELSESITTVDFKKPETLDVPGLSELVIDELLEGGELQADEAQFILDTAPLITQLSSTYLEPSKYEPAVSFNNDSSDHDDGNISCLTALLLRPTAPLKAWGKTMPRDRAIKPTIKKYSSIIDRVDQRQKPLLTTKLLNKLTATRQQEGELQKNNTDNPLAYLGDTNVRVLTSLFIIDVMAFGKSLSDDLLAKIRANLPDETNSYSGDDSIIFGAAYLELMRHSDARANDYLVSALNGEYTNLDNAINESTPQEQHRRGRELREINNLLREYMNQLKDDLKLIEYRANAHIDELSDQLDDTLQGIESTWTELDNNLRNFLDKNPSKETMIGALLVEKTMSDIFNRHTSVKDYVMVLHNEVDRLDKQSQLETLSLSLQNITKEIEEIDDGYQVSGSQVRKLGGKELRRQLLDISTNGSEKSNFNNDSAQQIAGLSLQLESGQLDPEQLTADIRKLSELWNNVDFINKDKPSHRGLLKSVESLIDCFNDASPKQLNDKNLKAVWELAKIIKDKTSNQ